MYDQPAPAARPARLSLAVGLVVAGLFAAAGTAGCDKPADTAVRQQLDAAYARRTGGDEKREYAQTAAKAASDSAAADFPDSTASLAQELLGDVNVEQAEAIFGGDGGPSLYEAHTRALALSAQANALAGAIALGGVFIEGKQDADPQATLAFLAKSLGSLRTGEDWSPGGDTDATLQSVAQTQGKIDAINARIEQLSSKNAELDRGRQDKLAQASTLDEQSRQQGGRQGVETFRRVSDLRNEASDVTAEQSKLDAQLKIARQELAEQQTLADALAKAVTAVQGQETTLKQTWQNVQAQIAGLRQANDATYGGEAPSVEGVGQQLADAVKAVEDGRREAERLLDGANAAYVKAAERAGKFVAGLNRDGDRRIAASMTSTFDTKRIKLKQAAAKRQLGQVHLASANVYAALVRLQETLEAGGRKLPASLGVDPKALYTQSVQASADAFKEAGDQLANVTESATGPLQSAAITQKAVLLSGMLSLTGVVESTGVQVPSALPARAELEAQVKQTADAAKTANATLPPTPAFASAMAAPAAGAGATAGGAQAEAEPGDFANAGPEEQAVRAVLGEYLAAVQAGEAEKAKSLVTVAPGAEGDDEVTFNLLYQAQRLRLAADEKFGGDAAQMDAFIGAQFGLFTPKEIKIEDDKAYFPQAENPQDVMLEKTDGRWKLFFEPAKDDKGRKEREQAPALSDLFKQAADETAAGQYPTFADLQKAFAPRIAAILGGGGQPPAEQ